MIQNIFVLYMFTTKMRAHDSFQVCIWTSILWIGKYILTFYIQRLLNTLYI